MHAPGPEPPSSLDPFFSPARFALRFSRSVRLDSQSGGSTYSSSYSSRLRMCSRSTSGVPSGPTPSAPDPSSPSSSSGAMVSMVNAPSSGLRRSRVTPGAHNPSRSYRSRAGAEKTCTTQLPQSTTIQWSSPSSPSGPSAPSIEGRSCVPTTYLVRFFTAWRTAPASMRMCRGDLAVPTTKCSVHAHFRATGIETTSEARARRRMSTSSEGAKAST